MAAKKKQAAPGKKLTANQRLFVAALGANSRFNATQAAAQAGYSHPKNSGWELLNLPQYAHVQEAVKALVNERLALHGMGAEEWMSRACAMIKIDRRDLYRWTGEELVITPTDELSPEQALLIRDVNRVEMDGKTSTRITRIKLIDPTPYFMMVGKAMGLFKEHLEIDTSAELKAAEESLTCILDKLEASLKEEVPGESDSPGEAGPPL